jgi:hypothetical protein
MTYSIALINTDKGYTMQIEAKKFPPLDQVTSPTVTTEAAAYYLNRKSQTLRTWACFENGPIKPLRIVRRLAWNVTDIKSLCRGAQ